MLWLVSGFMRSGTSMMMSCLEAGGMSVVKSEAREQFGQVHSDEHYKVNAGKVYCPACASAKFTSRMSANRGRRSGSMATRS